MTPKEVSDLVDRGISLSTIKDPGKPPKEDGYYWVKYNGFGTAEVRWEIGYLRRGKIFWIDEVSTEANEDIAEWGPKIEKP